MKKITTVKFLSVLILLILVTFISCSEDSKNDTITPENLDSEFELSDANVYEVESAPNSIVYDEKTGVTLSFPEGGIGNVSISKILSTPSTPTELGEGVKIEYTGNSPIALVVDTADGYDATVFAYGYFGGYYDIESPNQWESIPIEKIDGANKIFHLTMPYELQKSTIGHTFGSTKYWIATLKSTATIIEQKRGINHQNSLHYKKFIVEVPSSIKTAVQTKRKERYLREVYVKSGPYYSGFWSRPFGIGITYEPAVHLTLPPRTQQIAHEIGHYFIHLLVGDNVQSTLEGQANIFDGHSVGDLNGRDIILEDLAYFMEFFLVDLGADSYDLTEPYIFLQGKNPLHDDLPSYEGFTAHFLGQLVRTKSSIRNYRNGDKFIDTPVLNLSYGEVFEIISQGATDINTLRTNIEKYLGSQSNKLPAIVQRMGWSYEVKGRLVDANNNPIAKAKIESISKVGNKTYKARFSSTGTSKTDGTFKIYDDVFPGKSTLRIKLASGDSTDIPIEIDWDKPTTETIDLGDLVLNQNIKKISIHVQPTEVTTLYTSKSSGNSTNFTYDYLFVNGSVLNKNGVINGNTVSVSYDTTDNDSHTNTNIEITFDDIANPTNIVGFYLKEILTYDNGQIVSYSASGQNVPFVVTDWFGYGITYLYEYEGNISQYLTEFEWKAENDHHTEEAVSYTSQGDISITVEYAH